MQPTPSEIEEVGKAFIEVVSPIYTPEQQTYLNNFLQEGALQFEEATIAKLFNDKPFVIEARKTLHHFGKQYQAQEDIMAEFQHEIEELLINLNQLQGSISI